MSRRELQETNKKITITEIEEYGISYKFVDNPNGTKIFHNGNEINFYRGANFNPRELNEVLIEEYMKIKEVK